METKHRMIILFKKGAMMFLKKKSLGFTGLAFILVASGSLWAELKLSDKPVGDKLGNQSPQQIYQSFTFTTAMRAMEKVGQLLGSFQELTIKTTGTLSAEERKKIGHLDMKYQGLVISANMSHIEGTLRKQDYLIKKLEYELAQERLKHGVKIATADFKKIEQQYKATEREFEDYLNKFVSVD